MIHELFDLAHWSGVFPIEALRAAARDFVLERRARLPNEYPSDAAVEQHIRLLEPCAGKITGPQDLVVLETLRWEAFAGTDPGPALPTAVFVWAEGEPTRRETTRIGGLPYLPLDYSWPLDGQGRPLPFIGQLCFADCPDLAGPLPGDVLLMFGHAEAVLIGEPDALACHWVPAGEPESRLVTSLPEGVSSLRPVYGVLHRTVDLLDSPPDSAGTRRSALDSVLGTKIGGVPYWIQGDPGVVGRFIASLGSILPDSPGPYPLLNHPGEFDFDQIHDDRWLMWGDVGLLNLFIDEHDTIHWSVQCY